MSLFERQRTQETQATIAQVTSSQSSDFSVMGTTQQQGLSLFGPRGIYYKPQEKDRVLLLSADGTQVCLGVLQQHRDIAVGELLLASQGGATIHLLNNGEIVLNGLRITKQGELIAPKGG